MKKLLVITLKIVKLISVVYLFGGISLYFTPVVIYFIFNIKLLLLEFKIPFIDYTTNQGYFIHSIYHFILITIGSI